MFTGKKILLVIGGGIAAYKSLELIRLLRGRGAATRVVLTRAAQQFVTPLSVSTLAGEKSYNDLFDLTDETEIGHIRLGADADLIIVAPATADLMAKMALGLADDLASATLLAASAPILIAPAMNSRMWSNPATQRNVKKLRQADISLIGPEHGLLAEGEVGIGRMSEPQDIVERSTALLRPSNKTLAGKKLVVTSGPTVEPIDPIRYIANRSSGKQGHAIAAALAELGGEIILVSGPVNLEPPPGTHHVAVETAREMRSACERHLPCDAMICCAAVADWRVENVAQHKIKKQAGKCHDLTLTENPDILAEISRHRMRPALVIGFAAETENLIDHATAKRQRKGCDWILANDVSAQVMGHDHNAVVVLTGDAAPITWPRQSKAEIGRKLAGMIADYFSGETDDDGA